MISLDTETTGIDLRHGAKPFFVTTARWEKDEDTGKQRIVNKFWPWEVDPLTREPQVDSADVEAIAQEVDQADSLVLQNGKFDVAALATLDSAFHSGWQWEKTYDTLLAGHLLASNKPHNLTDMTLQYLGRDIYPLEEAIKQAVIQARRICRYERKDWRVAKEGLAEMPSCKATTWKYDMWLPRALALDMGVDAISEWIEEDASSWLTLLQKYSNTDSAATLALIGTQISKIKERDLWEIYLERLKILGIASRIEERGVTLSETRLKELEVTFSKKSQHYEKTCVSIAKSYGHSLTLPKAGNNKSLLTFCFDTLKLPAVKRSEKTGDPSLDKEVVAAYQESLTGKPWMFIRNLASKRKRDTALGYMESYRRYWKPWIPVGKVDPRTGAGWYVLHPSLNPTGTDTLRWSSSNPNEQNISKQEDFNIRYCFGPGPGREWWSLDAKNIERRLPAYEANETEIIALFERPDDPPYYGSEHLLVAHLLWPEEFEALKNEQGIVDGRLFKKKYAATLYQWVKNGNFAMQYNCGRRQADRTYHKVGAFDLLKSRFRNQEALNQHWIDYAEKHGYVETIPDRTVNPRRGYPLLCERTEFGNIKPTVPLNYHVQGTACWWMMKAMIRCDARLREWQNSTGFNGYMVMQVHDELVFDFPLSKVHPKSDDVVMGKARFRDSEASLAPQGLQSNLWRVRMLQKLMEQGGEDIMIPTPCGVEYHTQNWSVGETL
jgi:DNA polymerase I-like protein with 3'-5' exonuclease and polymerase domains